jgi:PAS domain S-box-containing protein
MKMRILIVEDEGIIANDIKRTLIIQGYEVIAIVTKGEEAVIKARELEPDIILMDIMLEGNMDGIEAAEKIYKELELPIIFLTAYSNNEVLRKAITVEAYGYILKPFEERELYVAIELALYKHKMQKILRESEKKYRDIFENANEAICIVQDEKLKFYNLKTSEFFDYPYNKLNSTPFLKFVHPDDRELVTKSYNNILKGKRIINFNSFRILDDSGNIKWLKINSVLITWENKPAVLNFMSDITEQMLIEEEIRKFKVISDNANYGIAITDLSGKIEYINKYFANVHGYNQQDLIGYNFSNFYDKKQEKKYTDIKNNIKENGNCNTEEIWHTHRDGSTFPMLLNGIMIKDQIDKMSYIAILTIDITDRKKFENIQSELFKELENVNDELQNFAYVVSHDLKAPLRAISTLANWISTDYSAKFDEEGQEQMQLLISRVKRMHNLIDGILEYSRVGRIKEEKIIVNLNELLDEVIDIIAPPDNIKITVENKLPTLSFERTRIGQVFQNLLSNAIKFMDKPKGTIKIGSIDKVDNWEFYISDNGPGIEEKHFSKIFKIFQTLHPRDEFESTGIGLTLIKKIINMYGGKIWIKSKVDDGTTFYFTLPKISSQTSSSNEIKE